MVAREFAQNSIGPAPALVAQRVGSSSEPAPAVSVEGLWWRYPTFGDEPNTWTLRNLSLTVRPGECLGITGPSGAGKTTLCRTLLGILPYSSHLTPEQLQHHFRGSVSVLGEPVTMQTADEQKIGMVLQDPENQFLRMSLLHELGLSLQIKGLSREEILPRAYDALCQVGLEHLWSGAIYRHPADLSGGQKQRVAIAAFLALHPSVLILDEPTSDLDPLGKREVIETIARLRGDDQQTVILVEQDPDLLATFCDRIALLHEGRIQLVAPPASFYRERERLEHSGVTAGDLARISWGTGYTFEDHPPLNQSEAISAFAPMVSGARDTDFLPTLAPAAEDLSHGPLVEAEGVTYRYGDGTQALKGIDLKLYRGEMLALLGPNGSGKTTFARILAGLYRATQGKVRVAGLDLAKRRVRVRLPETVGYVFQNPDHQLFCRKVRDEIEYGLRNLGIDPARRREIVASTLEAVDLASYAEEDPLFLSKGQRQRLAVAAILAMGPDVLIVDEPTTGQDYRSITAMMSLLCNLQKQGKTILLISHDMTLVAEYCHRAVAFRDGSISFRGTPGELFCSPELLRQTGLRPPPAAALAEAFRQQDPAFPQLITVSQWTRAFRPSAG